MCGLFSIQYIVCDHIPISNSYYTTVHALGLTFVGVITIINLGLERKVYLNGGSEDRRYWRRTFSP